MTKLLVLSDSHGGRAAIERVLMKESKSIDALIFLGDGRVTRLLNTGKVCILLVFGIVLSSALLMRQITIWEFTIPKVKANRLAFMRVLLRY